jgi:hypothetical protein
MELLSRLALRVSGECPRKDRLSEIIVETKHRNGRVIAKGAEENPVTQVGP